MTAFFFLFYWLSRSLKINQALKRELNRLQFYFAFHWTFFLWWKTILYWLLIYGSKEVVGNVGEKKKKKSKMPFSLMNPKNIEGTI